MKILCRNAFRGAAILALTVLTCLAKNAKIASDLDGVDSRSTIDVIVQFHQSPSDKQHKKVEGKGGKLKTKLDVIKGVQYSIPAAALPALAADPDVAYISPDRKVRGTVDLTTAAANAGVAANYGLDGSGVGIAIVDSGVTLRTDLKRPPGGASRIVYSQDFTGSGLTDDVYGHGTHVAGIAAGNGKTTSDLIGHTRILSGVAPGASIINLRVLDNYGQGTDSAAIAAIQQAIALKAQYNIRVLNLCSAGLYLAATAMTRYARPLRLPGTQESWSSRRRAIRAVTITEESAATAPSRRRATILT